MFLELDLVSGVVLLVARSVLVADEEVCGTAPSASGLSSSATSLGLDGLIACLL